MVSKNLQYIHSKCVQPWWIDSKCLIYTNSFNLMLHISVQEDNSPSLIAIQYPVIDGDYQKQISKAVATLAICTDSPRYFPSLWLVLPRYKTNQPSQYKQHQQRLGTARQHKYSTITNCVSFPHQR